MFTAWAICCAVSVGWGVAEPLEELLEDEPPEDTFPANVTTFAPATVAVSTDLYSASAQAIFASMSLR
jgi:hypothetical protein